MIHLLLRIRQYCSQKPTHRPGYIFLISVLFIGSIAVATVVSLLLLGWAAEQNGQTFAYSTQALEMAKSCLEIGVQNLRDDLNYAGDEMIQFSPTTYCTLLPIQGNGNSYRTICSEGKAGSTVKRIKMELLQVLPSPVVNGYEETTDSGDCTPANPPASSSAASTAGTGSSIGMGSASSTIALGSSSAPLPGSSAAASTASSASGAGGGAGAGTCGNGVLDPGEECDDGNTIDDACTSTCVIAPGCTCTNDPSGFPVSACQACAGGAQ
jgi:cysteine-rich repeat protein